MSVELTFVAMKRSTRHAALLAWVLISSASISQSRWNGRGVDSRVDSLLNLMTLEEKIGQLNQLSVRRDKQHPDELSAEQVVMIRSGHVGSLLGVTGAEDARKVQEIAVKGSRMGIPLLFGLDVIHGFRTISPIPLAEACSWDPAMVERSARMAAVEASAAGVHWTFAPMVDIARDPRWGRIAEGSGEDPFLGSAMAAARVRGFQGTDLTEPNTLMACAKHFAAYGGAEGGRDYNTADIPSRTLREIYLPPFKAAVDAGAGSLMCSFNEIAGVPSSANRELLTDILRGEWGFKGLVVSDWNSVGELLNHGIAGSRKEAAMLGLLAGLDMDMQSTCYMDELPGLIRSNAIAEEILNESVRRVLRMKYALGLFDDPYRAASVEKERNILLSRANRMAAREIAGRSIVLLKNEDNMLPLSKSVGTIAVIGPLANDATNPLGCWSALGRPADVVSVLDGVKRAVSRKTRVLFAKGCTIEGDSTEGIAEAVRIARRSDAVILVAGESSKMSGEASSRSSLDLPGVQNELILQVQKTGKPVVLVLMNGRPLSITWPAKHVPAIVEAWFLGVETGNAVADVLFGDMNPGGKLCVTFPRSVGQVPVYYNHKNTGRPPSSDPFSSKYLDLPSTPLYPFGFGLSYTMFSYAYLQLDRRTAAPDDTLHVSVEVKNTGKRTGDEVVQLYIRKQYASVTKPVKELKGFRRVMLAPGESQHVKFLLTPSKLAFYNQDMRLGVEPGRYTVFVGTNSTDLLESGFEIIRK